MFNQVVILISTLVCLMFTWWVPSPADTQLKVGQLGEKQGQGSTDSVGFGMTVGRVRKGGGEMDRERQNNDVVERYKI